jgi:hypothetical protein
MKTLLRSIRAVCLAALLLPICPAFTDAGTTWATGRVLKTVVKGRTVTLTTEVTLPTPCTSVGKRVSDSTKTVHLLRLWGEPQKGNCIAMIARDTMKTSLTLKGRGTHRIVVQSTVPNGSVQTDTTVTVRIR